MTIDPDELARRNRALTEQVELLVQTEQRLFRAQRDLERQLRRIEVLNEFALAASGCADDGAMLERALGLLLELFPYDQAAALLPGHDGLLRVVRAVAAPGLAAATRERVAGRPSAGVAASALPSRPTTDAPPSLAPLLALVDELFATGEPQSARPLLVIPLRSEGRPGGLLVARKVHPLLPYTSALADDGDVPFLRLLASHVEAALDGARLRARLGAVIANLPNAIFVLRAGRVIHSNEAARRLLGESAPEGHAFAELVPAEERDSYAQLAESAARDGMVRLLDRRLVDAQGNLRPVEIVALSFMFEGEPATLVIVEDVRQRDAMHTELAFTDRLATVGALAAGVAHEVNNPLTYMLYHLERLAAVAPDPLRANAAAALDGAVRIRDIVRDLQTFARGDRETIEPIDVHAVLEKVLALAAPELRYRARVTRDFGPPAWALASEGRLAQVFLNLVINAAHAMNRGGVDQNELIVATTVDGDRASVAISDTGAGIAPADLPRIFEPFFTTKESAGSGLGLSICRNIIESFGGTIEVTSALGRGTRFTVRLPLAAMRAAELSAPSKEEAPSRARVLVVDDDPRLLTVLVALLGEVHEVSTALGGAAAVDRIERGSFDAIVCDVMMPDVSGVDVYRWATLFRPDLAERFVFLTGGAVTRESQEFLAHAGVPVLSKPMRADVLFEAIERVQR